MQPYDFLMIIVLALAVLWGAWKGLAWQIASILSIVLSYFVALHFRLPLSRVINASPPWNMFLAMLILFLGTGMIVWVAFNLVSEIIERVKLKEFDRQLGALFGAAKGVLLCVLITLFSVALLGDTQRQAICTSKSGYYIALLIDRADVMIPRELHDVLAPYLDRLDRDIPHVHTADSGQSPGALWDRGSGPPPGRAPQQTPLWQQELEAAFSGKAVVPAPSAAPAVPNFPTGELSPPQPPLSSSQPPAGPINAQPVGPPPTDNGLRRW
jgi:membrane protein required for colicin V production